MGTYHGFGSVPGAAVPVTVYRIPYFIEQVPSERLVTIQATSPQRIDADLDAALARFARDRLDSQLSAVRTKCFFWQDNATPINYDPLHRPRRQDFAGTLIEHGMENGAFTITRRAILEQYRCRLGGRIGLHEMPEHSALEIDEPEDWARVEAVLEQSRGKHHADH